MKARQREWTRRSRSRKKAIQQLAEIEEISSVANNDPTPSTENFFVTVIHNETEIVKLRQGSGKERQGKARMAKGERP